MFQEIDTSLVQKNRTNEQLCKKIALNCIEKGASVMISDTARTLYVID